MEELVPSDNGAVSWEGIVVAGWCKVKLLGFDPATWTKTAEAFCEVVGPGSDSVAGAESAVDEIEGFLEDPGVFQIVNSKLPKSSENFWKKVGMKWFLPPRLERPWGTRQVWTASWPEVHSPFGLHGAQVDTDNL